MERYELPRNPKAESYKVEDIVAEARRGRIRVPPFQRPLKWDETDVCTLFDSILRGYPIGSLLLWRRKSSGVAPVRLGPILIEKPDEEEVRWLVDGQQRVTALVAALTAHSPPDPRFDIWFDPDSKSFHPRPSEGPELTWVALPVLLDAAVLGEFLLEWGPGFEVKERRKVLLEAGKRIREYPVPAYVIEAEDDQALRQIFRRINRQGKPLTEPEVFDALVKGTAGAELGLGDVAGSLRELGWGTIDEDTLLWAALALQGLDPTKALDHHPQEAEALWPGAPRRLLPAMQRAVEFLRADAGIPHVALLPWNRRVLVVLGVFFERFPDPSARSRRLLVRWLWRDMVADRPDTGNELMQDLLKAIVEDEEGTLQRLLAHAPAERTSWDVQDFRPYADRGEQKLALLGLVALEPKHLVTGEPLPVVELLERGLDAFRIMFPLDGCHPWETTVANWILYPEDPLDGIKHRLDVPTVGDPVLASHAIGVGAAQSLRERNQGEFLEWRFDQIVGVVNELISAHAEWDHDDHPSVRVLLKHVS